MAKFRPFSNYNVTLTKRSDGMHNLQAEASDASHHIELNLSPEQAFELVTKGSVEVEGRVNGSIDNE